MNSTDISFCVVEADNFVPGNKLYDAIQELRYDVLRKPLGMAPTVPFRLDGPNSFHVLVRRQSDERFVGTVSVALETGQQQEQQQQQQRGRVYQMAIVK